MLTVPGVQLWLCTVPTDMRCSYDGLSAMVKKHLNANPSNGQVYIFINRRRTQLKCLYFESGGYCLWCKRLEQGQFAFPAKGADSKLGLTATEFAALIEGFDLVIKRRRKRYKKA
jgi:transposase